MSKLNLSLFVSTLAELPSVEGLLDDYKGAHKTVILKITIMASVRRDWQRNNGYLVRAGYLLFFCRREKQ